MRSATARAVICGSLLAAIGQALARPAALAGATILERQGQLQDEYDYVIVGAGTAGLTVADRLTANGERQSHPLRRPFLLDSYFR